MAGTDKPVTVRLAQSQLRELMGLSIVDNSNLAEQIRRAVEEYVTHRLEAPDLQAQVASAKARQSSVLEALARR